MTIADNSRAFELGSRVVYQVYIKSFQDSDGDGMGDLRGITSRLDYLVDLGIDCLWITPFFPSPQNDNGYDVSDYCAIEPIYGTMDDFDELSRQAKARGLSLMLDMVFNHTSTEHEWFRKALAGDPRYLAYYKFVDAEPGATADDPGKPPTNWESKFSGNAWEYVPSLNKWYLHLFDVTQADLDWDNPQVRKELAGVLRFYVGLCAHAEARGKRKSWAYVIIAGVMAAMSATLVVMGLLAAGSTDNALGFLAAGLIELTSLLAYVDLIRSAVVVKRLTRRQRQGR